MSYDALTPPEMAHRAESVGAAKAGLPVLDTLALAVLAGAFIGLGALFSTTVTTGAAGALPYGVARLLAGLAFSLGLVLVVTAGAELFTGNNLIVMAWASRRASTARVARNWALVYAGNLVGAVATATLVHASGWGRADGGRAGDLATAIASAKTSIPFGEAVARGILCNALVCLAVWLTYSARTTTDRILAVVPPIAAFVAAGFEHSVANMYFIPLGIFEGGAGAPSWGAFAESLVPVTIGNVIGGAALVAAVYWVVYLRPRGDASTAAPGAGGRPELDGVAEADPIEPGRR
jgi:formate transporter